MNVKHTPTPWYHRPCVNEIQAGPTCRKVAQMPYDGDMPHDENVANADFIVLACDAHDELLELVRNLADVLAETHKNMPRHHCTIGCCDLGKWEDQARRLVARAANGGRGSPLSAG